MMSGMIVEYLTCRADLNFEVDFGVNGVIGTVAIALSTIAITHLYIISIQIAIMSIVKPCLHITKK